MEDKSTSDSTFIVRAAKKVKRQKFRQVWLEDPELKLWLQQADDPLKAKCTVCSKLLRAKKSHLVKHGETDTHIMNIQQKAGASISVPSNATINRSDTENDSSSDSTFVVPVAKQAKRQAFREAWLEKPYFKPWLLQADDPLIAKCSVCSKSLSLGKSHLQKHAKTNIHTTNIQQKAGASISVPSNATISSSNTENDSSSAGRRTCPSGKIPESAKTLNRNSLKQAFRKAWLKDPQFQLWLQETEDPHKAKCTVCFKCLRARKSHLQQHANTTTHITNMKRKVGALISAPSNAATTSIESSIAKPSNAAISSSGAANNSSANVSIAGPSSAAVVITRPVTKNDSSANVSIPGLSNATAAITRPVIKNDSSANVSIVGPNRTAVVIARPVTKNDSSIVPIAIKPKTTNTLHREQAFRKAWLQDPQFRSWLQQTEDPHKAKCTLCSKLIRARKCDLQQHAITDFHVMNIKQKAAVPISVPSNAATKSIGTNFARSGNAVISSIGTSFARPGNAAISSIGTIFARPVNTATSSIGTIFARPGNAAISSIGTSFAKPVNAAISSIGTSFTRPVNAVISSSGAVNIPCSGSTFILPVAKKVWRQTSGQTWLQAPHLKPWLQKVDDPHKAKGAVCFKYVVIGQSVLQNHANSKVNITNMVHQKEALPSTVKRTSADNVKVAEMTICIDAVEHGKKQCEVEEVPSTSSASEAANTHTRKNGETSTITRRIHPIVHDHRYARIPGSMWKKIIVQKKQIQALKRERHVDKQHIFRLKKQVTSLKRIVNKLRETRALPDSELKSLEAIADKNKKNIKEKRQISKGSGNTI